MLGVILRFPWDSNNVKWSKSKSEQPHNKV